MVVLSVKYQQAKNNCYSIHSMTTTLTTILTALVVVACLLTTGTARLLLDPDLPSLPGSSLVDEPNHPNAAWLLNKELPECFALVRAVASDNQGDVSSFGQACLATVDTAAHVAEISIHITVPDMHIVNVSSAWVSGKEALSTSEWDRAKDEDLLTEAESRRHTATITVTFGPSARNEYCRRNNDGGTSSIRDSPLLVSVRVIGVEAETDKSVLTLDNSGNMALLRLACQCPEQKTMRNVSLPESQADMALPRGESSHAGTWM